MNEESMVLYVEDNENDIKLLKYAADGAGKKINFKTVSTLADALQQLDSTHFSAVLLDLGLPDSFGYRTFEKVISRAGKTPVVIFSSLYDESISISALKKGAAKYFIKGVDPEIEILNFLITGSSGGTKVAQMEPVRKNAEYVALPDVDFRKKLNHDLRGCLNNINSFQEILVEEPDISEEEKKDFLARIDKCCNDGFKILNQVFD